MAQELSRWGQIAACSAAVGELTAFDRGECAEAAWEHLGAACVPGSAGLRGKETWIWGKSIFLGQLTFRAVTRRRGPRRRVPYIWCGAPDMKWMVSPF